MKSFVNWQDWGSEVAIDVLVMKKVKAFVKVQQFKVVLVLQQHQGWIDRSRHGIFA